MIYFKKFEIYAVDSLFQLVFSVVNEKTWPYTDPTGRSADIILTAVLAQKKINSIVINQIHKI